MTRITVVAGLPGVGKTTFATVYAARMGAALVDRDTLMGPVVGAALVDAGHAPEDHATSLFLDVLNGPAYRAAEDVACEIAAASGVDVVLVAPYTAQAADGRGWWDDLSRRIEAAGATPHLLWLDLSREEHRRRLNRRAAGRDRERSAGFFDGWWAVQNRTVPAYAVRLRADLPVQTLVELAALERVPLTPTG